MSKDIFFRFRQRYDVTYMYFWFSCRVLCARVVGATSSEGFSVFVCLAGTAWYGVQMYGPAGREKRVM